MSDAPAYRRLPAAERRDAIISAAAAVISGSGFNGVALDVFARAAGMTKAGLLHHFPTKDALLVAVLDHRDQAEVAAALTVTHEATDAATARRVMRRIALDSLARPHLTRMYAVLSAEALDATHPAHEYFARRQRLAIEHLAGSVLAWHPSPQTAAVQLLGFVDGLHLLWLREPDIDVARAWEDFADAIFGPGAD